MCLGSIEPTRHAPQPRPVHCDAMKLSKRKRMRALTATAELVSLWHRLQGRSLFQAGDLGHGDSNREVASFDREAELALWRACAAMAEVFEFDGSPVFHEPEPEPGSESRNDEAMLADSWFTDETDRFIQWLNSVVIREEAVATATLPQIGRLIDTLQSHDRFCGGLWESFVTSGHLGQAIQRLEALLQSHLDVDADPAPTPSAPGWGSDVHAV